MGIEPRILVRNLLRHPGFALVTVVTLALAIAANAVIFSFVDGILLTPLPYPRSERLVRIYHQAPGLNIVDDLGLSDATYFHYRDAEPLEDLAVYSEGAVNLAGEDEPVRVPAAHVSHSLFAVLETPPILGRPFVDEDERPGAPPVALISHRLWEQRFDSSPDVIAREVRIEGRAHEVVGVMPVAFAFPTPETRIWLPMGLDPDATNIGSLGTDSVGRLAPGWSVPEAEARLAERVARLEEIFPIEQGSGVLARAGFSTRVVGMHEYTVGGLRESLWLLLGSVGLVLLIACGNVANLFLARAEGREQEMAVRAALGARRAHLVAAFLGESVLLGLMAGAVALPLTFAGVETLARFGPENLPRLHEVTVDTTVLGFGLVLSLVAGLLLGAFPALRHDTRRLGQTLKEGGRGDTAGRSRLRTRNVLVAGQVALALVLLVGSGLLIRSSVALSSVDPGFDPTGLLTFRLALPAGDYPGEEVPAAFVQELVDTLAGLPGVESAGAVSDLPLSGRGNGAGVFIEGHPEGPDDPPKVHFDKLTAPGYVETMRIPLVAGRSFRPVDHQEERPVVIVNRAFAQRYWPGGDALGRRIQPRDGSPDPERWLTIVGVVETVRSQRLDEEPAPLIYYPMVSPSRTTPARQMTFVVRTRDDPMRLVDPVRHRVRELDSDLPLAAIRPMSALVDEAMTRIEFTMVLLAVGAGGALLIGAVGIYGVIAYLVRRRTREIGIRMALGARSGQISGMVVRRSLMVTVSGLATGLLGALALAGFLRSLLYEVEPLDPLTFSAVTLLLLAIATLAAWVPARRAARVDPLEALRRH